MSTEGIKLARNKRVLARGGLLILLILVLYLVPSPSGNVPVMLFETLLMVIFAMVVTGTTGPATLFIALSAIGTTALLPIFLFTVSIASASGGLLPALQRVISVLIDPAPIEGFYLVVPSIVASVLALILARSGFRLPGYSSSP